MLRLYYISKPCFEHALLGFNFSLVVFYKYKRIERSSAGPDKYNLWLQLIFSVHTFVQSFCCQCFVYFCYSFVTINHFNSDSHHVHISYEVSFRSVTKDVQGGSPLGLLKPPPQASQIHTKVTKPCQGLNCANCGQNFACSGCYCACHSKIWQLRRQKFSCLKVVISFFEKFCKFFLDFQW